MRAIEEMVKVANEIQNESNPITRCIRSLDLICGALDNITVENAAPSFGVATPSIVRHGIAIVYSGIEEFLKENRNVAIPEGRIKEIDAMLFALAESLKKFTLESVRLVSAHEQFESLQRTAGPVN